MGTGLRGFGWFKWDLLQAIYAEFAFAEFPFSAVTEVKGFDRKTFFSLHQDGWLTYKKTGRRTSAWKLSTAATNVLFPDELPDELVSALKGKLRRAPSKRATLHSELFVEEVLEAIAYFSKQEVAA